MSIPRSRAPAGDPAFPRPPRPPLPLFGKLFPNPLDALPAAINHLLAAEPWARSQLAPHVGKTLDIVVQPFTIRLTVVSESAVARASSSAVAATTVTIPYAAVPRILASGPEAAMRDLRIDGDADFAQAVSLLAKNLRWDVEEDLSKVVGDAASHRMVAAARSARDQMSRTHERMASGLSEYLLEENPQLVRPRAVERFADGVRTLRDDLERLEKRLERLTAGGLAKR